MPVRLVRGVDLLLALGFVALLLVPLLVVAATPQAPPPRALPPVRLVAAGGPERGLTSLPVFGTEAGRERARAVVGAPSVLDDALREAARDAFGELPELAPGAPVPPSALLEQVVGGEPLPGRREALLDLVGLVLVADAARLLPGGSGALLPVLQERAEGDCAAALTLLLATRGQVLPDPEAVTTAARTAARACPGDPTPGHALAVAALDRGLDPDPFPLLVGALRAEHPSVALALEADRLLADADLARAAQPFTARALARQARERYRAARRGLPEAGIGEADALRLLGEAAQEVTVLREVVAGAPASRPAVLRLAEALERDGRHGEAADLLAVVPPADPTRAAAGSSVLSALDERSATGSRSLGLRDGVPMTFGLGEEQGAPGFLLDVSFVPGFRPVEGLTGGVGCPAAQRVRDLVAAGRAAQAVAAARLLRCGDADRLRDVAAALAGGAPGVRRAAGSLIEDEPLPAVESDLQAVQRWAGDLTAAARTVAAWRGRAPRDAEAALAGAEVAFLRGRREEAARAGLVAARLAGRPGGNPRAADRRLVEAQALLVAGAARAADDRPREALTVLERAAALLRRPADPDASSEPDALDDGVRTGRLAVVEVQRGVALLQRGDGAAAGRRFDAARTALGGPGVVDPLAASVELGTGLAAALRGDAVQSVTATRAAVRADPASPVAWLDLGYVQRRAGDVEAAEEALREALRLDPRLGLAALDLGTLLAAAGRDVEAGDWLRRGLAREPGSAHGWHSLGVVLARGGPRDVLQAQAAFARAAREDRAFRGRERTLVFDERLYVSRLDLSRPLPDRWSFAAQEQRLPLAALLGAALVGLVGYVRGRWTGRVVGRVEDRARDLLAGGKRVPVHLLPAVAVVATLGVLLQPVLGAGLPGVETAAVALGLVLLLAGVVRLRRRLAGPAVRHVTWTPALVVGVVGAASGVAGFAPLPGTTGTDGEPRVHRAGPLLLFGTGLLLLALATATEVPVARVLAMSALAMSAVCLTPAGPYDGPHVRAPRALRAAALVGTAIALGLATGVL